MEAVPRVVLLAAGASERLGEPKALVDLGGESAIQRLLESCGDPYPLLVVGAHAALIKEAVGDRAEVIDHPDWASGRTGSVACAVSHLGDSAILLSPLDCPLVPRTVFDALQSAWQGAGAPASGWLAPLHTKSGRHGHPVLFGGALASLVLQMDPASPLRELRALADPLLEVSVDSAEILDDLDTPEDLSLMRERL